MDALLRVHNMLAGMPLEERRVDKRVALAFVVADMTGAPLRSTDPTVLMSTKPPWRYFSPAQARGGNMTTALEHYLTQWKRIKERHRGSKSASERAAAYESVKRQCYRGDGVPPPPEPAEDEPQGIEQLAQAAAELGPRRSKRACT